MRRIRVIDNLNGDFFLHIPDEARVTFGYFNPSSLGNADRFDGNRRLALTTALRVYSDGTDKRQIACILGVHGFRDETQIRRTLVRRGRSDRDFPQDVPEEVNNNQF